jgi:hypothetical protein
VGERILDRIVRGNWHILPDLVEWAGPETAQGVWRAITESAKGAVAFDVSNVASFFYAHPQEVWSWTDDFPNLAPPFNLFWMECERPPRLWSKEEGERDVGLFQERWGCLFAAGPNDDATMQWISGLASESAADALRAQLPPDEGWLVVSTLLIQVRGAGVIGPWVYHVWPVRPDGRIKENPVVLSPIRKATHDAVTNPGRWNCYAEMFPFGLAISFLHCKNVKVGDAGTRLKPVEQRRAERAGAPVIRFKTLEIEPMRRVLAREGQSGTTGLQRALHICRGHFATYSPERPLFGRLSGTFWVPAHVRGTAEAGMVGKDYRVKSPIEAVP